VAKIEALFEQSRTARQALDRIPPLLKKFRQAVLAAAFRGDLTRDWREQHPDIEPASALLDRIRTERRRECEGTHRGSKPAERKTVDMGDLPELPARWVWCALGQCTSLITKGESPNWQGYQYVADGVPFVRSENVLWGVLDLSEVARIPDTFHQKLQRSKLKPNDVLVNLVGASIGRCAVVPPELSEANINQAVATIRTTEALCPPYLLHLLLSPAMQEVIQGKRVEVARPNISLGDLRNLIVPLAPAAEQEHIVCRMEQLFVIVAAIEAALEAARRRADKLEQSILTRAFHGELVPQDPNDEPACTLLDRVRTQPSIRASTARLAIHIGRGKK
jgi:type I restriction enzyme S subunit